MTAKTNDQDRPDRPDLPRGEFEALHAFQGVMYEKLAANRHKGGWQRDLPWDLIDRLEGEVLELKLSLKRVTDLARRGEDVPEEHRRDVARECADVANFAMMIADVVGGLKR